MTSLQEHSTSSFQMTKLIVKPIDIIIFYHKEKAFIIFKELIDQIEFINPRYKHKPYSCYMNCKPVDDVIAFKYHIDLHDRIENSKNINYSDFINMRNGLTEDMPYIRLLNRMRVFSPQFIFMAEKPEGKLFDFADDVIDLNTNSLYSIKAIRRSAIINYNDK